MTALVAYTEHVYPDRAAWLAARREGIGGSDAPVIVGLSPWQSPAGLYAERLGLVRPQEQTEAMELGLLLEPVIRTLYEQRTGRQVLGPRPWLIRRSTEHPFMAYSPDGSIVDDRRGRGVFQAKTCSAFVGQQWDEDEPPLHYLVQLQHEIAVEGASWGVLAVLIGGQRFRYFDCERHDRLIAGLVRAESEFWDRLARQDPPPVDGTRASAELVRALHPKETAGALVQLPDEAATWDADRLEAMDEIKRWTAKKEAAENSIRNAIGDAEVGMLPGLVSYSWSTVARKEYTVPASATRVLRRREAK